VRVVSGSARGRKLLAVPGDLTRPILDRVKTALFDTIRPQIQAAKVLDLFGGTGAIGIEALSQGAAHCIFLDLSKLAAETIRKNLAITEFTPQAEVRQADAFSYLRTTSKQFDLIFIAPPQYQGIWIEAIRTIAERPNIVSPAGTVIVQIDPKEYETLDCTGITEQQQRKYGNTLLVYYGLAAAGSDAIVVGE